MKSVIRKEILALRQAMPIDLLKRKSEEITKKVTEHSVYQEAEVVFAYIDAKGEVKTRSLIEHAWKNDKMVAVPKVYGDMMKFRQINSYDDLEEGCFGILEPKESCEEVCPENKNNLVIMPGVAFDMSGNRIGYGKGYYDRYFEEYPGVYKIATAFSMQIVDEIPCDEFDIKADCVITEE